jgi:hypothetical protein
LDAASEELLFRELAQNADLRREMNAHVRLQTVAKRDAARVLPTERDKAAIFGRLGLASTGAASTGVASTGVASTGLVSAGIAGASTGAASAMPSVVHSYRFFSKQTLRYAATILVTAFLTWWLLRYGVGGEQFASERAPLLALEQPVEMTMLVPIEKRIERVIEKQIERQIITRIETRYKTIVRYLRQDEDSAQIARMLASEKFDNLDANTQTALTRKNTQPNAAAQNGALSDDIIGATGNTSNADENLFVMPYAAFTPVSNAPMMFDNIAAKPDNILLLDSINAPLLPALPKPKEFIPTAFALLRLGIDISPIQRGQVWGFSPFNLFGGAVGYNCTKDGILGLEASVDGINARNEQGIYFTSVPVASVFYRHVLHDWTIEVPEKLAFMGERITPFVQVNVGSAGIPIVGRAMIGATFYGISPDKRRLSNSLGIEVTHILGGAEQYIPKVSLSFSQNFNL